MQFLETVLIIILIYFAVKILLRFLTPYIMKYFAKKITKRFGGSPNTKQPNKKEGSISIDKTPPQSKKSNNSVGEYVDYEEID